MISMCRKTGSQRRYN